MLKLFIDAAEPVADAASEVLVLDQNHDQNRSADAIGGEDEPLGSGEAPRSDVHAQEAEVQAENPGGHVFEFPALEGPIQLAVDVAQNPVQAHETLEIPLGLDHSADGQCHRGEDEGHVHQHVLRHEVIRVIVQDVCFQIERFQFLCISIGQNFDG